MAGAVGDEIRKRYFLVVDIVLVVLKKCLIKN